MRTIRLLSLVLVVALAVSCSTGSVGRSSRPADGSDRYADYVWPPPPDIARIRLVDIISERLDVEAESRMSRTLLGASPRGPFDRLQRPIGVAIDRKGRILVTDVALGAVLRFDREERRMDVFGTTGSSRLRTPIAVEATREATILVADGSAGRVVEYDDDGRLLHVFGRAGDLMNATDAALSPDGRSIYVCDSKAHQIVVFDRESGEIVDRFGRHGAGNGEFNHPTSLAFASDGSLFVVDQINARVQILSSDGEYLETLGGRGTRFGQFVRPKDISIDRFDLVYVTDAAFNNVQIFDEDLRLLTFVGQAGNAPGEFQITGGVSADDRGFVVVDQLGKRVQLFRYVQSRTGNRSSSKGAMRVTNAN